MSSLHVVKVDGPSPTLSFHMRLLSETNAEVVNSFLGLIPIESFLLHVVIAGETFYMPVPSFSLSSKNMVQRRKGVVYYNTGSQSICFCYGTVTESTMVNQFAEVFEEDFPRMEQLGKVIYKQTINSRNPKIVTLTIRSTDNRLAPRVSNGAPSPAVTFSGNWKSTKAIIDEECAQLRLPEEPDDIKKVRLGAVTSRAAGEGSPFQTLIFLQGFLSTLGPHVFARLLAVSEYAEMTLPLMVRQTREFLVDTFDHFKFMKDLGLHKVAELGRMYENALDKLETIEDYRQLTDSIRTLVQLHYRWLHLVFPWYLKDQFQTRTAEEVASMPKLQRYLAA
ncbi:hypothetical protein F4821DRAFT_281288 [Hypoxylon rubiginosum]|uniref:Uncharacterized protein n=1 Tax=Hypoxylon rubiginosum TaxID=110542 RepID=A0ACC0DFC8_9PEZI|nr:hypothetical protein F4821DRAFT_281288 [Hypoxylon rubiginosum]